MSLSKETGYQDLEEIEWTQETLRSGQLVRIKEVPFRLRLFKLVDTEGNIEWVITNNLAEDFTRLRAIEAIQVRWLRRKNFTEVSSNLQAAKNVNVGRHVRKEIIWRVVIARGLQSRLKPKK